MWIKQLWIVPALLATLAWGCDTANSGSDTTTGGGAAQGDAAGGGGEAEDEEPGFVTLDFAAGDSTAGATVFQVCAGCHGADGKGMKNPVPENSGGDLSEEAKELDDAQFAFVVKNGLGTMVAQKQLSDQQIVDVIAYIRATFGQKEAGADQ